MEESNYRTQESHEQLMNQLKVYQALWTIHSQTKMLEPQIFQQLQNLLFENKQDLEAIYLLTDGWPNRGLQTVQENSDLAKNLIQQRKTVVRINSICFMQGGVESQEDRDKAKAVLQELAQVSGGTYKDNTTQRLGNLPTSTTHKQQIKNYSSDANNKSMQTLIQYLLNENDKLYNIIEKVTDERDKAQAKSLINEQIAYQNEESGSYLLKEYTNIITNKSDCIKEQNLQIREKQELIDHLTLQIEQLQKQHQNLSQNILPSPRSQNQNQSLENQSQNPILKQGQKLNQEKLQQNQIQQQFQQNTQINKSLQQQQNQIQQLQEQQKQQQLLQQQPQNLNNQKNYQNGSLKNQQINSPQNDKLEKQGVIIRYKEILSDNIQKLKQQINNASFINPNQSFFNNFNQQVTQMQNFNQTSNSIAPYLKTEDQDEQHITFIKEQRHMVGDDQSDEESLEENLPDKVNNLKTKNKPENQKLVPQLNLNKAKQIQDYNMKRAALNQQEQEMKKYQQQVLRQMQEAQLEEDLINCKIQIQEQMMKNKVVEDQIDEMKKDFEELEQRNEILINSNKNYQSQWQKVFHSLYFYREYYISDNKYFLLSKQKQKQEIPLLLGPGEQFMQSICNEYNLEDSFFSPESLVRFIKKKDVSKQQKDWKLPDLTKVNEEVFEILSARQQQISQQINEQIYDDKMLDNPMIPSHQRIEIDNRKSEEAVFSPEGEIQKTKIQAFHPGIQSLYNSCTTNTQDFIRNKNSTVNKINMRFNRAQTDCNYKGLLNKIKNQEQLQNNQNDDCPIDNQNNNNFSLFSSPTNPLNFKEIQQIYFQNYNLQNNNQNLENQNNHANTQMVKKNGGHNDQQNQIEFPLFVKSQRQLFNNNQNPNNNNKDFLSKNQTEQKQSIEFQQQIQNFDTNLFQKFNQNKFDDNIYDKNNNSNNNIFSKQLDFKKKNPNTQTCQNFQQSFSKIAQRNNVQLNLNEDFFSKFQNKQSIYSSQKPNQDNKNLEQTQDQIQKQNQFSQLQQLSNQIFKNKSNVLNNSQQALQNQNFSQQSISNPSENIQKIKNTNTNKNKNKNNITNNTNSTSSSKENKENSQDSLSQSFLNSQQNSQIIQQNQNQNNILNSFKKFSNSQSQTQIKNQKNTISQNTNDFQKLESISNISNKDFFSEISYENNYVNIAANNFDVLNNKNQLEQQFLQEKIYFQTPQPQVNNQNQQQNYNYSCSKNLFQKLSQNGLLQKNQQNQAQIKSPQNILIQQEHEKYQQFLKKLDNNETKTLPNKNHDNSNNYNNYNNNNSSTIPIIPETSYFQQQQKQSQIQLLSDYNHEKNNQQQQIPPSSIDHFKQIYQQKIKKLKKECSQTPDSKSILQQNSQNSNFQSKIFQNEQQQQYQQQQQQHQAKGIMTPLQNYSQGKSFREIFSVILQNLSEIPGNYVWRILLELAEISKKEYLFQHAKCFYSICISLQPFHYEIWLDFAKMEEELGNIQKAIQILENSLQFFKNNEILILKLLKIYDKQGDIIKVRQVLSKLANQKLEKVWKIILEGALIELKHGKLQHAEKALNFLSQNLEYNDNASNGQIKYGQVNQTSIIVASQRNNLETLFRNFVNV
ncbi:hypothetical protein PPERSA_01333 [Pseudocohnilembus persalinus]|uniref:Uncharacterized protein n=1 Tax=Pseudocohnilembus persalinus TaxID=266149 RepID=A0A0V0QGV4_PSEPJ|nr:hypothetical protein PPERSA_01333 [Pseudocohnilembus persalinus]|eukprot:KRX01430.1 hypothetical protein PPERSA_01333 [Pseudocohnilembus persalinus]